jgi:vitamin B12 transporter
VRSSLVLASLAVLVAVESAAEIKIKVVDPQSAVVAGAQVTLLSFGSTAPQHIATTSAEGTVSFGEGLAGRYRIQVLTPGFAPESMDFNAPHPQVLTVQLQIASATETVVVTATRTPVPAEDTGASISTLENTQLEAMQPVSASDAIRFLPGAIVNNTGQRGGLASLFVRGGDSTYNKVIVDGVTINEPGGTFDFGTFSLAEADRAEFVRGAQSTLYGTDAMTSIVQLWTRTGSTPVPELRFGADGGNFATAHGYASLAGTRGGFDYNLFGDQFNTNGEGTNNAYSDSVEGANLGVTLSDQVSLRARFRHFNTHTGVPGEWNFNGFAPLVPVNGTSQPFEPLTPDPSEWSQYNNLLGSVDLAVAATGGWEHRFTGFDYLYRYTELNLLGDPLRLYQYLPGQWASFDFPSHEVDRINRVGFEYQGDYSERTWARTTFGYRVENENGSVGDADFPPRTAGQRLNNDFYAQQQVTVGRLAAIAGGRLVHDSAFGTTGVPRVALAFEAIRGNQIFSGTRLRFSYATGLKEPRLEETFAGKPYSDTNPGLKPERVRAFEAGLQQNFLNGKYVLNATYFNNLFQDQINYVIVDPIHFIGQYVNVNQAFAHGAEVELEARLRPRLLLDTAYTYTSTQILDNPAPINALYDPGQPLLRRPKHSATFLLSHLGNRGGANLGGSFVGRRPDSDFLSFNIDHAPGYVRVDLGGWYEVDRRITAYVNVENALDRHYNEVVGYPALGVNFRAGVRFRLGGE